MKISVIGCGYLGAVHAAAMASLGHEVVGVDVDADKVAALTSGRPPFFEPGLSELLVKGQELGSLEFTTDVSRVADSQIHFVCVGTPQKPGEFAADVTYVDAAVDSLVPHLTSTSVVVGKSTVPVGTAERLAVALVPTGAALMWNPEFLREGHAVEDTLHPNRLVYGVADGEAGEQATAGLDEVYATMLDEQTPRMVTDFATAELVKTAANSFLATKISFINAMAELCEASGADVTQLADAIGIDDRIGRKFLNAGLGFGGGCLPKDIRAFMARAGELGADQAVAFLKEIDSINMRRRVRMVDIARDTLDGSFIGKKITVLGAAFKPNSDDVRDSPALAVARLIATQGGVVTVTDPQAIDNAAMTFPELNYVADTSQALADADAVLLLTEWQEYRDLDPVATASLVAGKVLIDGRNVLTPEVWRSAGWTYRALGRP
ncbi:MAG: UDP-glucose/GDP-mannose dehydrogenase family protein [Brevibacterium sp.]|uniref:UDP-glucose dehydrogenase family protein n=1 Tax=Brevibacterium sp. TaxID=1701 RepID=UPI0026471B16|nr:UDP-glucose/GDP-mannose dehydrogenase family protein [Brevibacterium sp.]MDN5806751.1 UDP-glucose/GDP-mannose dehydrogenase family protein [Brevibacterium sp.]MDN5832881.1 UDP-glucose/GDP-mannose dehydrogenase family protein [Brevibacterium sp.]MDN5875996.1 UDP-glucose/GDP-mannose dehydrogenase family protein [Brevibacterium sp.]MDN5908422.1 UDP-glucose/GDP-mannose dehydrogenase family protein [Brevibacterium sp.]MDN6123008.1 UDP-glucose/GDP-mannose dehydrogenase family protein [Brevibacter